MVQTEIEIKAYLPDENIVQYLTKDANFIGTKTVIDTYLDTPNFELYQLGVFLRIRNNNRLDIKYNSDLIDTSHLDCQEYNFAYPLSSSDEEIVGQFLEQFIKQTLKNSSILIEKFELIELAVIEKERSIYRRDGIEIAIDTVNNLGKFIEIEALDLVPDNVLAICNNLNLENIPVGYVELFLRKHNFDAYKKGRYLLQNDKE